MEMMTMVVGHREPRGLYEWDRYLIGRWGGAKPFSRTEGLPAEHTKLSILAEQEKEMPGLTR